MTAPKPKSPGGQKKALGARWATGKSLKPRREPAAVAAMVAAVPMTRLACGKGCGKTFSYPRGLRIHEKACAERAAQSGHGDAAGFFSPPARCAGCGERYAYLAIHEEHCHGLGPGLPRSAQKKARNGRGRIRGRDFLCRKGCGRRYVYLKSLKTHETTCRGCPDAKPARCSSASNAPRALLSEEQKAENDPCWDATVNHAARAAANDAFTRAVFARLAVNARERKKRVSAFRGARKKRCRSRSRSSSRRRENRD